MKYQVPPPEPKPSMRQTIADMLFTALCVFAIVFSYLAFDMRRTPQVISQANLSRHECVRIVEPSPIGVASSWSEFERPETYFDPRQGGYVSGITDFQGNVISYAYPFLQEIKP